MHASNAPARLFVVSGPSGAGKGTVVRGALRKRPDLVLSVSASTRPARRGERHGVDYRFLSEEEFLAMRDRGEFLESAKVYGHYYGTPRQPVEAALQAGRDVIVELDVQGAQSVRRAVPGAVLIFIEPPSLDELWTRLRGRGTDENATIRARMQAAYEEMKKKGLYDYIVINDDVDEAVQALLRILESERHGKDVR